MGPIVSSPDPTHKGKGLVAFERFLGFWLENLDKDSDLEKHARDTYTRMICGASGLKSDYESDMEKRV